MLNFYDCLLRKPLEWRACLNNIDEFLQKWTVVQRLNNVQYATKHIVQGLVEHLLLFQQQEDWYGKRAKSQAVGTRNIKRVGVIASRNQSMLVDPNYSILNEDSSASKDEQENSFIKVKEYLASTGTNNMYKMLLMLV